MTRLHPGDTFPSLTITPADAWSLELPRALAGHFGVVLFYRGGWCPYCNAQLRAFQRAADRLAVGSSSGRTRIVVPWVGSS